MIKLFRKIRLKFLSENSFSKYLVYAIGEIILVVIGILIALAINNWNEHNKTEDLAETYILDIKKDLTNDTIMFNAAIHRVRGTIAKNKSLLNPEIIVNLRQDSIYPLLTTSFHSMRIYQIDNATYLKLSNTGFLESGLFTEVFSEINNYYNKEYVTYSEFIEWDEEQTIDIFHPEFLGSYKNELSLSALVPEKAEPLDAQKQKEVTIAFKTLIQSKEFQNKVWANYHRKELVVDRLLLQKQLATDLIKKINELIS